jgi:hypothetical protein
MQKNELALLDAWIMHHGELFGHENLYVFDNGSTDLNCRYLLDRRRETHGINVIYDYWKAENFESKGTLILEKIHSLDRNDNYDFYIPLDCDEFFSLEKSGEYSFDKGEIFLHLKQFLGDLRALEVPGCLYNIPMRENFYYALDVKKTIFTRETAGSLDVGFHDGASRFTSERVQTSIHYFHFHNKPFDVLRSHARSKLINRVKDFKTETLLEYRGQGQHLVKYFTMEEREYLSSFPVQSAKFLPEFRSRLLQLGVSIPY